jgi:hypothetical protein
VLPPIVMITFQPSLANAVSAIALSIGLTIVIFRAGLLGAVAGATTFAALNAFPWTFATSAWYAGVGSLGGIAIAALAITSFWYALGGRPVLGEGFFGK